MKNLNTEFETALCDRGVVLEKILESPLDCKKIQQVHPKDQSWVFIGRTDVEAETPIHFHRMQRADSFEKTLMLGEIEGRRRKGPQEDEMIEWHHRLNGHEFEQAPGVGDGQGSLGASVHGVAKSWTRQSD